MTRDEYRQHMRKFSRETMHMSFVVVGHPDYQALQAAGDEIVPWLLDDMLDEDWYCDGCMGTGMEPVPGWREEQGWPPRTTGTECPACAGKGHVNSWGCMTLLFEKTRARGDAPVVEDWMRGRGDALGKLWRKWGEAKGLLPATPENEPGLLRRAFRAFRELFIIRAGGDNA